MSAVKALALCALVVAAATHPAKAGALDRADLSWVSWTPSGVIETPATSSVAPATTASLFGAGTSPYASMTPPASQPAPAAAAPIAYVATSAPVAPAPARARTTPTSTWATGPIPTPATSPPAAPTPGRAARRSPASSAARSRRRSRRASPNAIVQRVEQTFAQSGVPITVTANPNAPAAHTLSVVSGTTSAWGPVLGLTNIGGNGFDFIDQAAKVSQSVDQLEWVVAHNISHELMLAFGVPENYDQTGKYIDARDANLSMMLNPKATFSQSAAQELLAQNFLSSNEAPQQGAPAHRRPDGRPRARDPARLVGRPRRDAPRPPPDPRRPLRPRHRAGRVLSWPLRSRHPAWTHA